MHRLSKSRVLAGLQCHKQLWWRVHEPDAPELAPDPVTQARLEEGTRVGRAAHRYVPGGVLVGSFYQTVESRLAATNQALRAGERVLYEANFLADGVLVQTDILIHDGGRCTLVEVKAATSVKDEHVPDVAVQLYVLRRAGLEVERVELMHLSRDCRHPDLSNLFVREDVTARAAGLQLDVPAWIAAQREALDGPLPDVPIGPHCREPHDCPFLERCWTLPPDHVTTLHGLTLRRKFELVERGWTTIHDLPEDLDLPEVTARQVRAMRAGEPVVEPALADALAGLDGPLAFLDFETIAPAIPVWPGCRPYDAIPVQFSCHVEQPDGTLRHFAHLAEAHGDPRPEIAHRLVVACGTARTILTYNVSFERAGVRHLAEAVPDLAEELDDIESRLVDLWPVVRRHVYFRAFEGSFSLKQVLPALVPDLDYRDLAIDDGALASVHLARLLLRAGTVSDAERLWLRRDLLAYCERDTLALARLLERLEGLARPHDVQLHLF